MAKISPLITHSCLGECIPEVPQSLFAKTLLFLGCSIDFIGELDDRENAAVEKRRECQ